MSWLRRSLFVRASPLLVLAALVLGPSLDGGLGMAADHSPPSLELRRVGALAERCSIKESAGSAEVRCDFPVSAMTLLSGGPAGTRFRGSGPDAKGLPQAGTITLPLAEEPRVALFWRLGDGYDGPLTVIPAVVVQAYQSAEGPELLLHDALHEPVRTARAIERERARSSPQSPPGSKPTSPSSLP